MANVITLIRIGLAISLLFIRKYSPLFLILYSILGVIALLSSIEELAINIKSKKLDLNKKSIFN